MRLTKFEILGFRGFSERQVIHFDDISTFVGKNDAGKSSVMDALNLFFEDTKKIDPQDLCITEAFDEAELVAEFTDFPEAIILDATVSTSLMDEYLLKSGTEDTLRIVKKYKKSKPASIFINASCPLLEGQQHPITLKHDQLKAAVSDIGKKTK